MKKSGIYKMVQIALTAVIITVCAWICIPYAVPFTMQSFGVYLALSLLGGKKGTASILLYILLGIIGLPVFASFGSSLGYLAGPTGGFILGFILCGLVYSSAQKAITKSYHRIIVLSAGTVLCYLAGALWFMFVTDTSFLQAITISVLPYILPDAAKLILAVYITERLKKTKIFR